ETTIGIDIDRNKHYDLYIYYASRAPVYIGNQLDAKRKAVIPNGNDVRPIEKWFDYVFCQAEDNFRYFDESEKGVLLRPCVIIPVDHTQEVEGLPEEFFLTVFNPYELDRHYEDGFKPYKGYDLLYELADYLSMPLVWCHCDESVKIAHNIKKHPNIIHMHNLEQEKMYSLYEHCTAYVSFSREESFGWAVADALMYNKPVISRRVGVISSLRPEEKGLYLYKDRDELKALLGRRSFEDGDYDKHPFSVKAFEKKMMALCK
ncbi:MAG: glycosyltransferase, partial [Deltaproteobacteria bacterium]|nr:glycosyltransferase [Deltaproteobacteria bacterium]